GMGPAIFKKKGKNTLFSLMILPLGGYCAMGEDDESKSDNPNNFRNKSVWRRMAVIVAGASMNLIMGFLLGLIILCLGGKYISTEIAEVVEGTECAQYLQQGDVIVKMNGMHMYTANDIIYQLRTDEDGIFSFVINRGGERITIDRVAFSLTDDGNGGRTLNYDFRVYSKEIGIKNIIPQSANKFMYCGRLVIISLKDLILGKYGLNQLQGPVGIVTAISETAKETGFDPDFLLELAMLISVNVGIFNLLPLPALDGGRFIFLIVEAIRRKPISAEKEGMVHFVGFAMLMLLMLAVTFNDIKNIFAPSENTAAYNYEVKR
ncbi:MAG: site-2 protease family protein, partial [Oscillospiraceae bacterium]|nr:site-2 protease family protein [Oscillospiraceae bacterium]